MDGAQQDHGRRVVMIVKHPDEGNRVMAVWQRIGQKTATVNVRPRSKARSVEPDASARTHGGKIEQRQLEVGRMRADGGQEGALAAAHIEQFPVTVKRIGVDNMPGNQWLRCGHQRRIGRDRLILSKTGSLRIMPQPRQPAPSAATAQQGHRIGQVGVEQAMMRDHLRNSRIADHYRASAPKRPGRSDRLHESQCLGGPQQSRHALGRQVDAGADLFDRQRILGKMAQQSGFYAGREDLRVYEACNQIEQLPSPRPRDRPGQRRPCRPPLKSR